MRYGIGEDAHLFALNPSKPSQVEIRLEMNTIIDVDIVKKAIEKTTQIFIRMGYKPVIDKNGDLQFVENNEPLPIYKLDEKVRSIGSDDTNHYLYCFLYNESVMIIILNHFITDGVGFGLFLNYFIYQYISIKTNVYYEDELIKRLESGDNTSRYDLISDKLIEYTKKYHKNELENINFNFKFEKQSKFYFEKCFDTFESDSFYECIIEYDVADMKKIIKELSISPLMFFTILFNDSIIEIKKVKEEIISSGILVNLRDFLKSDCLGNFAAMTHLNYFTKWYDLSFDNKIKNIKEEYNKAINYDEIVVTNAKFYNLMMKNNIKSNINKVINDRKNKVWRELEDVDTYVLTNFGNVVVSEQFKNEVKDVSFSGPLMSLNPVLLLYSYMNKGTIHFAQNVSDDSITKMLSEKMKAFGIKNVFFRNELKHVNRCDALLFEKV